MSESVEKFVGKIIKYKGKEYAVNKTKIVSHRNILFTNRGVLSLYTSELADVEILRNIEKDDIRKINTEKEKRNVIIKTLKSVPVERVNKRKEKEKELLKSIEGVSQEDEQFIIQNWSLIGSIGCKKELEISRNVILQIVEKHGLKNKENYEKKTRKIVFSEETNQIIKDNWEAMKLEDLSKKIGVSTITLSKHARHVLNLPARQRFVEPKKFIVNEEVTKNSDVRLYKDMNLPKVKSPTVKLKVDDPDIIKFSENDMSFIKKNWDSMKLEDIAKHFKTTIDIIRKSTNHLDLKRKRVVKQNDNNYSVETIKKIKDLWDKGFNQSQILKELKLQHKDYKRQEKSFGLVKRVVVKEEATKVVKKKRELSEEEKDFIRDNWMHKPMEFITKKLGIEYQVLNKLVKPLRLPVKRRIRDKKKKEKTFVVPSGMVNNNIIENYKELLEMLIKNQNSDKVFMFRKKGDDSYEAFDSKNNIIWQSDKVNKKIIQSLEFNSSAWNRDEESLIIKELMSYIRRRNMHIENNYVHAKILEVYPIDINDIKNIVGFLYFDEFLKDISDKTNRKIHAIKTRYGKLNLLKLDEKMKPENITSKIGRNN